MQRNHNTNQTVFYSSHRVYREGTAVMQCGLGNLLIVNILLTTRKLLHAGDVKVKTYIRYDVLCGITNATTLDAFKVKFQSSLSNAYAYALCRAAHRTNVYVRHCCLFTRQLRQSQQIFKVYSVLFRLSFTVLVIDFLLQRHTITMH